MDEITERMRTTGLGEIPEGPEQLLFNPQPGSLLDIGALDNLPRYLFRVVSPLSDGRTDATWVRSQAACDNTGSSKRDIFSNLHNDELARVARTLNLHLRWWPKDRLEDNFVSWTSSLLFAIQYIYYRHQDSRDGSSLEDIDLYVIDTTQFPVGTFLRDLDLIKAFRASDTHPKGKGKDLKDLLARRKKPDCYFGEYLSQGSLKIEGKCQRISAATILDHGLLRRLQPEFGDISTTPPDGKAVWVREVNRLRDVLYISNTHPRLSSNEVRIRLQAVEEIVRQCDPIWRFPIAIYFVALLGPESMTDDSGTAIDNEFFAFFRSELFYGTYNIPRRHKEASLINILRLEGNEQFSPSGFSVIAPDTMPELERVKQLMQEVQKHWHLRKALGLCIGRVPLALCYSNIGALGFARDAHAKVRILRIMDTASPISVDDRNDVLRSAGENVLTRLRALQALCGEVIQTVESNEGQLAD